MPQQQCFWWNKNTNSKLWQLACLHEETWHAHYVIKKDNYFSLTEQTNWENKFRLSSRLGLLQISEVVVQAWFSAWFLRGILFPTRTPKYLLFPVDTAEILAILGREKLLCHTVTGVYILPKSWKTSPPFWKPSPIANKKKLPWEREFPKILKNIPPTAPVVAEYTLLILPNTFTSIEQCLYGIHNFTLRSFSHSTQNIHSRFQELLENSP